MTIRRMLGAFAALCLSVLPAAAQAPPEPLPFALKQVGPGVYAAIGGPKAGSNAGFVVGDDGVLVVDSFYYPDAARALLAEIRKVTSKPIRYVVNTHYHIDHVAGDQVFKDAGAIIVAHRNVRAWMRAQNLILFGAAITPEQRAQIEALPLPDLVTDRPITLWLGARRVEVRPLDGHTGGDLVVAVPDAKVLFTGDLLWRSPPNIVDGTVSKWIATLAGFQKLPDAAAMTFAPGHGDVATVKDVALLQAYLTDLSAMTAAARRMGLKGEALAADVVPRLAAKYPQYPTIKLGAPHETPFMEEELAGTKRLPVPVP
jgi:glyoxylase-like metal-dependent hydrolase (beta-lactamase superfamily II)